MSLCVKMRAAGALVVFTLGSATGVSSAVTFDDVQFWAGTGANQAALVIDWHDGKPDQSLLWGYRWDGQATGAQMLQDIVAADTRLSMDATSYSWGIMVNGFSLEADNGISHNEVNPTEWSISSPTWAYWISDPADSPTWLASNIGAADRVLQNNSWDGWSFTAYNESYNPVMSPGEPTPISVPEPAAATIFAILGGAYILRRRRYKTAAVMAAISAAIITNPQSANAAYSYNANDFATEVISYTGPTHASPAYNDASAVLGRPPLTFNNSFNPNVPDIHFAKIIEAPFNYGPNGETLVTVLPKTPSIATLTVKMGRPVTDDPAHPFGADLIIFGNSFLAGSDGGSYPSDQTNLNNYILSGTMLAHPVQVSVSPDNINWYNFPVLNSIQPYNAYRWDETNAVWTGEELNPTLPLNPSIYLNSYAGQSAADLLSAYGDSAGGTGLDLAAALDDNGKTMADNGVGSIQYVRFASTASDYAAISGVSAVVPEPAASTLLGLAALAMLRRKRS